MRNDTPNTKAGAQEARADMEQADGERLARELERICAECRRADMWSEDAGDDLVMRAAAAAALRSSAQKDGEQGTRCVKCGIPAHCEGPSSTGECCGFGCENGHCVQPSSAPVTPEEREKKPPLASGLKLDPALNLADAPEERVERVEGEDFTYIYNVLHWYADSINKSNPEWSDRLKAIIAKFPVGGFLVLHGENPRTHDEQPCPDGDACPDARRYGAIHRAAASPEVSEEAVERVAKWGLQYADVAGLVSWASISDTARKNWKDDARRLLTECRLASHPTPKLTREDAWTVAYGALCRAHAAGFAHGTGGSPFPDWPGAPAEADRLLSELFPAKGDARG